MISQYNGRRIVITTAKRDGFGIWRTKINGVPYHEVPKYRKATAELVLEQIIRELDAVDADPRVAYEAHMYRKGDPRQLRRLEHLSGKRPLTEEEGGARRVGGPKN